MFEGTEEEEKLRKNTWFQSLSIVSSEEESDDSTCEISLFPEVQNANFRFPFPLLSDDSDDEVNTYVSIDKKISQDQKRSKALSNQSHKQRKIGCKNVTGIVGSKSRISSKSLPDISSSSNKKPTFIRDEAKRVWNYSKKRKKRHVYHRPSTIFSTSEDDSGPEKKKKKKNHGRKPSQLKLTSSEENLNESTAVPNNEPTVSRPFSSFIDSSSNCENSDCKENHSNAYREINLHHSFHDVSSSNNSTDSENSSNSTSKNRLERRRNNDEKRVNHCISSSDEENKETCKAKTKKISSTKRTIIPSKHPFKNLIAAQQLKEDNINMKKGLKPTSQRRESNNDASRPSEVPDKSQKKFDCSQSKTKTDPPKRKVHSKSQTHNNSKFDRLKRSFISSNKYSIELSNKIRSNMNMSKEDGIRSKHTQKQKNKSPEIFHEDQSRNDRSKSKSKEKRKNFSRDREESNKNEAKYTVNVNVYCNSNPSESPRYIPEPPEECSSKIAIDKEPSHDLDINLSVVQEENASNLSSKKVRISHINQSKSKPESRPTKCELNTQSKLDKNISSKRVNKHTTEDHRENKTGQFDLVGNIISQMEDNPYSYQKGTKKTPEQSPDVLRWFPNLNSAATNNQSLPNISTTSLCFNKGPAQYAPSYMLKGPSIQSAQPTTSNQQSFKSDPSYHPLKKMAHTSVKDQENTIPLEPINTKCDANKSDLHTNNSTVSPPGLAPKYSSAEVIVPFYSANRDEYEQRLENLKNNQNERQSQLNKDNVKQCSGNKANAKQCSGIRSNLSGLQESSFKSDTIRQSSDGSDRESEVLKEKTSCNKSDRSLPVAIHKNNKTTDRRKSTEMGQITSGMPIKNKNIDQRHSTELCKKTSGMQVKNKKEHPKNIEHDIKLNASDLDSSKITNSKRIHQSDESTLTLFNSEKTLKTLIKNPSVKLDQGAVKKGVKIRLQGNEYVWCQSTKKGAEDSSLKFSNNTLNDNIPNSLIIMKENNRSEENDLSKKDSTASENQASNKTVTLDSRTEVSNEQIDNSSSGGEKSNHSSSSDSDEETSSSDGSSSSSDSSASTQKNEKSDSSDSDSSEKTVLREENKDSNSSEKTVLVEHKDHSSETPTLNPTEVEVITLDSSSDDEPHTSGSLPAIGTASIELSDNVADKHEVKNEVDQLVEAGPENNNLDPVDSNIESETSIARITADQPILTPPHANENVELSGAASLVGKIRIKSAEELNNEVLQSENALKNNGKQIEADLSRPSTSSENANKKVEETKTTEIIANTLTRREPLKIRLSKVHSENKSLYKVQSTIPISNEAGTTSIKPVADNKKLSQASAFVVQTGEQNYKIVPLQQNVSSVNTVTSGVRNVSNVSNSSQSKKVIPQLIAIQPQPSVFLVPVSTIIQAPNRLATFLQSPITSCTTSNSNPSVIPPDNVPPDRLGKNNKDSLHKTSSCNPVSPQPRKSNLIATFLQSPITSCTTSNSNPSVIPPDNVPPDRLGKKNDDSLHKTSSCNPVSPQPRKSNLNSRDTLEATFFKLCDELFTEVICLKIPKMVDDLHLTLLYDSFKEERLKRTEQLQSPETILSEKSRAERDFSEQIRIRAQSFVPLFITVINKINKSNLKTLVIALYIRFIYQLKRMDHRYANYRLSLRHIIKAMLQKSGSTNNDVCQIFSDSDRGFEQNYLFIENLMKKYELYVEQRRQNEITTCVDKSKTLTNKERNKQKSKERSILPKEGSAVVTTEHLTLDARANPSVDTIANSTVDTSSQKAQETGLLPQNNVTNESIPAPSSSSNAEPTCPVTNLDELMFNTIFKLS